MLISRFRVRVHESNTICKESEWYAFKTSRQYKWVFGSCCNFYLFGRNKGGG